MSPSTFGGLGPLLIGVGIAETVVGTILVALRVWDARNKFSLVKWSLGWAFLAWFVGFVEIFLFGVAVYQGAGNHISALQYHNIVNVLHIVYIGLALGIFGVLLSKFAILSLLLAVTTPQQKKRRIFLWATGVVVSIVGCIQVILIFTQCSPTSKLWNVIAPGKCDLKDKTADYGIFQGSLSAAVDLAIALYPISIVWTMQASLRVKIGFCALMATGCICAVAGAIRVYYISALRNPNDATYVLAPFLIWCFTEMWLAIIIGSIPPLRPLFLRWFQTVSQGTGGRTSGADTSKNGTGMGTKRGGTISTRVVADLDDIAEDEEARKVAGTKGDGITVNHSVVMHVDGEEEKETV